MEDVVENKRHERKSKRNLPQATRMSAEINNPCIKESELAMKCMHDTNFSKDDCSLYFKNYRNCMGFWQSISRERRSKGIKPTMPHPEDRARIKQERFSSTPGRPR